MRLCSCCSLPAAPTAESVLRPLVSAIMYAVLWNCECGSTLAVVIWESEDE